jgi:hypothetical protein
VGLAAKPLPIAGLGAWFCGQHLDGGIAADHRLVGLSGLAHATLAYHRQQPVTLERYLAHGQAFFGPHVV